MLKSTVAGVRAEVPTVDGSMWRQAAGEQKPIVLGEEDFVDHGHVAPAAAAEQMDDHRPPGVDQGHVVVGGDGQKAPAVGIGHAAGVLQGQVEVRSGGLRRRQVEDAHCVLQNQRHLEAQRMHGHGARALIRGDLDAELRGEGHGQSLGLFGWEAPDFEHLVLTAACHNSPTEGGLHGRDQSLMGSIAEDRDEDLQLSRHREVGLRHGKRVQRPVGRWGSLPAYRSRRGARHGGLTRSAVPARPYAGAAGHRLRLVLLVREDDQGTLLRACTHVPDGGLLARHAESPDAFHLSLRVHAEDTDVALVAADHEALQPSREGCQAHGWWLVRDGGPRLSHDLGQFKGLLALHSFRTSRFVSRNLRSHIHVLPLLALFKDEDMSVLCGCTNED
mmetsp:Transcript_42562/g.99246  ORF Transcript_42562/g.99246 Transcript_42562/m.99246 type:complete len:389 (-) Transcript_42562:704-1870(-)